MNAAPVVLFVYNRAAHARQTLAALAANAGAGETRLVIYADGPAPGVEADVAAVRAVIDHATGFADVVVRPAAGHRGLAASVIRGVTEVVEEFGRAIVVEDDLVTSSAFLTYMNRALDAYADDEQVMHVAGYMCNIDPTGLPPTFFLRLISSWGWATWGRAWSAFEPDADQLASCFSLADRYRFNLDAGHDYWKHLRLQRRGEVDSWAVRWYASVFLRGGLSLFPAVSLVRNIGHDGTGMHCRRTDVYDVALAAEAPDIAASAVKEHRTARKRLCRFYRRAAARRVGRKIKRRFTGQA